MSVIIISREILRKRNPDFDKLLNSLGAPSLEWNLIDIFSVTGLLVGKYKLIAQPFMGAFLLRIYKLDSREKGFKFLADFTISDLLNKSWESNIKLSSGIKVVLEKVYDKYIEPNEEDFLRVLNRKRVEPKVIFRRFTYWRKEKNRTIKKVLCKSDQIEKEIGECFTCQLFLSMEKDGVICKNFQVKIEE